MPAGRSRLAALVQIPDAPSPVRQRTHQRRALDCLHRSSRRAAPGTECFAFVLDPRCIGPCTAPRLRCRIIVRAAWFLHSLGRLQPFSSKWETDSLATIDNAELWHTQLVQIPKAA